MKRGGGRRYYRPDDVDLLRGIRHLLYGEGYTIRGVQRILREQGIKAVQGIKSVPRAEVEAPPAAAPKAKKKPVRATPLPQIEPEPETDDDDAAEMEAAEIDVDETEADETSIVVSPPIPKPFTTPLPSIELRRSSKPIGMVLRSEMPPELERPPKIPPAAPPPSYLPDISFDTPMPVPRRIAQQQVEAPPVALPEPEPAIVRPPPPLPPAPDDAKRLRPVLDELMAVRRLLDAAMQGDA